MTFLNKILLSVLLCNFGSIVSMNPNDSWGPDSSFELSVLSEDVSEEELNTAFILEEDEIDQFMENFIENSQLQTILAEDRLD